MNWIREKAVAAGFVILAVLAAIFRFRVVKSQRDKARIKLDRYRARSLELEERAEAETELDRKYSDYERERIKDIRNNEIPDNIIDRNNY